MRTLVALVAVALAAPVAAAETGADGSWACHTFFGTTPVAYVALSGNTYVLTAVASGKSSKGTVRYADSPIAHFEVTSGRLPADFDAVEGIIASDESLYFDGSDGGISLMCEPGTREK